MKKNSIAKLQVSKSQIRRMAAKQRLTVGLDLGDRSSRYCILDEAGEKASEDQLPTTKAGLDSIFGKMAPSRIALEEGTHSPWVSRHLAARPIRHRGPDAQADLAVIRARAELVEGRTTLINAARGLTKPMGERLKSCDADTVKESMADGLSEATQKVIRPLLKSVAAITQQIQVYNEQIQEMEQRYPETRLLKQVHGVGPLIALTFMLTLEDAERFEHSRDVGPYLGLTRKQRDVFLRRLLLQAAHCILRQGAPDSDLKAWGLTKVGAGAGKKKSKSRKKKAAVAVARKLAVLLHHLWVTGEVYDPQYNRKAAEGSKGRKQAAA